MTLQSVKCEYCVYRTEKDYSKAQFNMCWQRIQDIADILRVSKPSVYQTCLKRYGRSQVFEVDALGLSILEENYPLVEIMLEDKDVITVKAYKGIEYMSSKELSIFTDGVLEELQEVINE